MGFGFPIVHGDEQLHQRIFIIGVKVLIGLILLRGDVEMYMTLADFCQVMLMLIALAGFLWTLWTYWNKRR